MHQTATISPDFHEFRTRSNLQITNQEIRPIRHPITPNPSLLGKNTQVKITHTSNPVPSSKSNTKYTGVPENPLGWQPHFFSLARSSAEYVELRKSGRMPIAGFTRLEQTPTMRRIRKAGRKVARDMARRTWGVDW
jgi:hypothetical protein